MREIRSSGSGEGPGWATSRPTLQRYFCPGVSESAPPEPPPPGRGSASVSRGLRLQGGARIGSGCVSRVSGGAGLDTPVVEGRGGTTAPGSAQVQHARRRWDDATGRGLSRTRSMLGDHGLGQWEVGRTRAGDAVGCA